MDDRFDVSKLLRVSVQVVAALILVHGADISMHDLGQLFLSDTVELGKLSGTFTVIAIVTAINAFNIFDGSNGIAGGQALVALLLFGGAASMTASAGMLMMIVSLSACVAGFLIFNWPTRATRSLAFMGDAGSTVLGFALAWLSIGLSQGPARSFSPVCVLWIFALPIYDMLSSIVRRIVDGRSPLAADSGHLHHQLRRYFRSCAPVAYVIVAAAAAMGFFGMYAHFSGAPDGVLFIAWLAVGGLYHAVFGTGLLVEVSVTPSFAHNAIESGQG